MNILLTGGAGFIGSNVLQYLVPKYPHYKFVALDRMDYCSSFNNLEGLEQLPNFKFVKGSILSPDLINYILKNEQIDTILHFAAQTHVDNSFGNSFEFTENNVMGTHILLEEARVSKVKLFVHVSTDEVYGESNETCTESNTVLNPTNPYAATKMAAEALVKSYVRSFNLPAIITRGNNVYGPRQYPEKIIPKFICRLQKGSTCCLHGSGQNSRNYLYVDDVSAAFDIIIHKGEVGQVYNIGTEFCISNLKVARDIIRLMNLKEKEEKLLEFVEDRPFNDYRYNIDTKKLRSLGWTPEISWEDGLKKTIDWYRNNSKNWSQSLDEALKPHPTLKRVADVPSGRY